MNRIIKTKERVLSVKTADHNKNLSYYMKSSSIRYKGSEPKEKDENTSASESAIEDMKTAWKRSFYESGNRLNGRRPKRSSVNRDPVLGNKNSSNSRETNRNLAGSPSSVPESVYQEKMKKNAVRLYAHRPELTGRFSLTSGKALSYAESFFRRAFRDLKSTAGAVSNLFSYGIGAVCLQTLTAFFGVFSSFSNTSVLASEIELPEASLMPDFTNEEAWGMNNPYTRAGYTGQCTWFAWGRFYEIYGYDPGFRGDGWNCAFQLVNTHPDKFELSYTPSPGAIFSSLGRNHVGIVISVEENKITVQEGNLDGRSNLFIEAITDWREVTYPIGMFINVNGGVVYAVLVLN